MKTNGLPNRRILLCYRVKKHLQQSYIDLQSVFRRPEPAKLEKSAKNSRKKRHLALRAQTVTLRASKADFSRQAVLWPPPNDCKSI